MSDNGITRWRGELFKRFRSPLVWLDDGYYQFLEPPHAVSFPICCACGEIIWDWPHFEEEIPRNACCDRCANEEEA